MEASDCAARFKRIPFHGRIRIFLGLILSFLALMFPFYNVEIYYLHSGSYMSAYGCTIYYWSFKQSVKTYSSIGDIIRRYGLDQPFYVLWIRDVVEASSYPSVYFDAYWFNLGPNFRGLSELLMMLFAMQLLTLGTGLSSLFIRGKGTKLVTVLSGATVAGLMLFANISGLFRFSGSLRLGFWLAVLAEVVCVFDLGLEAKRKVV
jgi:hypothetical protein